MTPEKPSEAVDILAALCFDQLKPGIAKQIAEDAPVVLLILNHQDALAHGLSPDD
jgi:hypothetical protein